MFDNHCESDVDGGDDDYDNYDIMMIKKRLRLVRTRQQLS